MLGSQAARASPGGRGSPIPPRAPESLAPLAFLRPCFKVDFRQHAGGLFGQATGCSLSIVVGFAPGPLAPG
jgi:hypothetical protein